MTDQISNEAYKQIMIAAQDENEPCEDCISRQAVLDLINADWKYEGLEEPINSLPSVNPQEPCDNVISRTEAILQIQRHGVGCFDEEEFTPEKSERFVIGMLNKLPPVTPQQKTGQWIENAPEYQNIDPPYICSECGNMHLRKTNYCDQCGVRMVEPQESEDKE